MHLRRVGVWSAAVVCFALGVLVVYRWTSYVGMDDKYSATHAQLASLEMKIEAFALDTGQLPKTLQDLLVSTGQNDWRGPYAKKADLLDPWGQIGRAHV